MRIAAWSAILAARNAAVKCLEMQSGESLNDLAIAAVENFWTELSARDPWDIAVNLWGQWLIRLPVTVEVSPYVYQPAAEPRLRELLEKHLRLAELPEDSDQSDHRPYLLA